MGIDGWINHASIFFLFYFATVGDIISREVINWKRLASEG